MEPERWRQVEQLFHAALEREESQRATFLAAACGGDEALRREVESLLATQKQAENFMETPAVEVAAKALAHEQVKLGPSSDVGSQFTGRQFSHYRILERLGAGGMGEVYRAHDEQLDRDIAIKVLPASSFSDPAARARLLREARAAAALNHPHICTIHEVGEAEGQAYIAMEYVEGQPLSARLAAGPLPAEQVLRFGLQLAEALAHAHDRGIVHRDLKSANVIITADGRAKVLDFGLAKRLSENELDEVTRSHASLTAPGVLVGTLAYMAPERFRGQAGDAHSDIWALGVVLYEMAAGTRPFQGQTGFALSSAILNQPPPSLPAKVPVELRAVIERCLVKESAERYPSAVEVHRELRNFVLPGSTAPERSLITRRHFRVAGAAVLVILMIAAFGGWTLVRRARAATERKAAVAEVEHLVDRGHFVDVWRVGRAALQRWPHDPQLEHAIRATTNLITIATDPPGAEVAFKAYEDIKGEWLSIGTTPLREVRAPLGQLRWRITKSGFEPLEARLEVGAPAAAAGRPDVDARPIRLPPVGSDVARMVFVPGGRQGGWSSRTTGSTGPKSPIASSRISSIGVDTRIHSTGRSSDKSGPICTAAREAVPRFGIEPGDRDRRRGS